MVCCRWTFRARTKYIFLNGVVQFFQFVQFFLFLHRLPVRHFPQNCHINLNFVQSVALKMFQDVCFLIRFYRRQQILFKKIYINYDRMQALWNRSRFIWTWRINKYYSQNIFVLNYRQYISNYIIYIFVEAHWRNTWSVRPCYTYVIHLLKQDHRSRHPQTLIPLHTNRWRRSHHYTNELHNRAIYSYKKLTDSQLQTKFTFV